MKTVYLWYAALQGVKMALVLRNLEGPGNTDSIGQLLRCIIESTSL
jgi:hypothetical protein